MFSVDRGMGHRGHGCVHCSDGRVDAVVASARSCGSEGSNRTAQDGSATSDRRSWALRSPSGGRRASDRSWHRRCCSDRRRTRSGRECSSCFFYSLGLGIPFLLTSLLLAKAFSAFDWVKRHFTAITVFSGVVLALFGLMMVTGQVVKLSGYFADLLEWVGLSRLAES